MLFQGTERLHQGAFKVIADAHYLSGSFHLRGQRTLGCNKFVKRQPWNFYDTIIQHRLKTGISLAGYGIFDFIQRIAHRNFCRHLGNRIAGGFGSQR